MPGIADAKHSFTVEDDGAGGSRVSQTEVFRGVLAPFLAGSLDRHTLPAFVAMNEGAENPGRARGGAGPWLSGLTPRARQIVTAARGVLESEGADAVTMRRVADELGVRAVAVQAPAGQGRVGGRDHFRRVRRSGRRAGGRGGRGRRAPHRSWTPTGPSRSRIRTCTG